MTMPPSAPGFVVATELRKAAWDNGFRIDEGEHDGWLGFASATAPGAIWLRSENEHGPWLLALEHVGVAAEFDAAPADIAGPGKARFAFASVQGLHDAVRRAYQLAVSLPDAPLQIFEDEKRKLPNSTEAERLVVQRVGQNIFRDALLRYWKGRCPLTGIEDAALLRASHIIPWSECAGDAERLDVHNGLLLSALWDAAFDRGLVSFADDGAALFSANLSAPARAALAASGEARIAGLTDDHKRRLARHRATHGFS